MSMIDLVRDVKDVVEKSQAWSVPCLQYPPTFEWKATIANEERMYERFTDRARKVMQRANQEAQRYNHKYIGPEHILLGLLKVDGAVGVNILKSLAVDLRGVRLAVEQLIRSGSDMVTMGALPQTPAAKAVIGHAIEEARWDYRNYIGTEHILLGLLTVQSVPSEVL